MVSSSHIIFYDRQRESRLHFLKRPVGELKGRESAFKVGKRSLTKDLVSGAEAWTFLRTPCNLNFKTELMKTHQRPGVRELDITRLLGIGNDPERIEKLDDKDEVHLFNDNEAADADRVQQLKLLSSSLQDFMERTTLELKTFHRRSRHAQVKYYRKAYQKHSTEIAVLPNSLPWVMQFYNQEGKNPVDKLGGLRVETLSLMLLRAGLREDSRVAVFDHSRGAIFAAVQQRLAKEGPTSAPVALTGPRLYTFTSAGTTDAVSVECDIPPSPNATAQTFSLPLMKASTAAERLGLPTDFMNDHAELSWEPTDSAAEILTNSELDSDDYIRVRKRYDLMIEKWKSKRQSFQRLTLYEGLDCMIASVSVSRACRQLPDIKQLDLAAILDLTRSIAEVATAYVNPAGRLVFYSLEMAPAQILMGMLKCSVLWSHVRLEDLCSRNWSVDSISNGASHPVMSKRIDIGRGYILSAFRVNVLAKKNA